MSTLSDLLRNADPLRDEAPRPAEARQRLRDAVMSAPIGATVKRRSVPLRIATATGVLLLAGIVVTQLATRHTPVRGIAVMRFEARLAAAQETIVDNADILTAQVVPGRLPTTFGVALTFTREGADKMRRATEAHVGEQLELLVDGDVVAAPKIRAAISKSATLSGDYTYEQASRIVEGLLKGKIEVRSQQ
jgi:preprotein translocase subunit SecD